LNTLIGHNLTIRDLVLLINGELASCSDDTTIKIWNLTTGRTLKTLEAHVGLVNCIKLIKNDLLVSGSSDMTIQLWNVTTGLFIRRLTDDNNSVWSLLLLQISNKFDHISLK
jgi:WD40 repeat protein